MTATAKIARTHSIPLIYKSNSIPLISINPVVFYFLKDGYRDGLEKGEGDQLQSGFNAGYGSAVKTAFRAAHLRGAVRYAAVHVDSRVPTLFWKVKIRPL